LIKQPTQFFISTRFVASIVRFPGEIPVKTEVVNKIGDVGLPRVVYLVGKIMHSAKIESKTSVRTFFSGPQPVRVFKLVWKAEFG